MDRSVESTGRQLLAIPMPSGDRLFARHLRLLLDRLTPATPEVLERRLHKFYPRAQVHPRELSGEVQPTWYVYREAGLPPLSGHWWEKADTPALVVDGADRIRSANIEAGKLLGLSPDLLGRHILEFFPARSREDASIVLGIIRDTGSGESRWSMLGADGDEVYCAFRAAVGPAGLDVQLAPVDLLAAPGARLSASH